MSEALYIGMMGSVNFDSANDRKRAKRRKILGSLAKAVVYGCAIVATALNAENAIMHGGIASAICTAFECLR